MRVYRQTDNQKTNIINSSIRNRKETQSHQYYDLNNQDRLTLQYLMQLDPQCDVIVNCNQTINISIFDRQAQANKKSFRYPNNKKIVKTQIFVGSGFTKILGQCFESYNNGANHDYVFTCFERQSDASPQQMDQNQLKDSSKHFKKSVQQINYRSNTKTSKSKKTDKQIRMDQQSDFKNMKKKSFILSEPSHQSQQLKYVQPLEKKFSKNNKTSKQNLQRQIRNNLRNITNTYLQKMQGSASEVQIYYNNLQQNERLSGQYFNINKISQGQRRNGLIEMYSPKKCNQDIIGQCQQEGHLNLSFAKCKQLPQAQPKIQEYSVSEYLPETNQANVEQEVKRQVETASKKDISEVSELDCPINIHLQSQKKLQSDKPIENAFLGKQDTVKVQLNHLADQRERQMNNFVQITQKVLDPNRSEYFVKYNCRILQKRTHQTDVVRVSPFKHRKIEVHQIPLTKNIEKLSEIIQKT